MLPNQEITFKEPRKCVGVKLKNVVDWSQTVPVDDCYSKKQLGYLCQSVFILSTVLFSGNAESESNFDFNVW